MQTLLYNFSLLLPEVADGSPGTDSDLQSECFSVDAYCDFAVGLDPI